MKSVRRGRRAPVKEERTSNGSGGGGGESLRG